MFRTPIMAGVNFAILTALELFALMFGTPRSYHAAKSWVRPPQVEPAADSGAEVEAVREGRRIIYVGATWCGPCQQQKGTFAAMRQAGRPWEIGPRGTSHIQVFDYDARPDIVRRFNVKLVPTWVLLDNERPIASKTGPMDSNAILDFWNRGE